MPALPFSSSLRQLQRSRPWATVLPIVAGTILLSLWGIWSALARVPVYEISNNARIESGASTHPVQAAVDGPITSLRLTLGDIVSAGQPLIELDAAPTQRRLEEKQRRLEALERQQRALETRVAALRAEREVVRTAEKVSLAEARERVTGTQAELRAAEDVAQRRRALDGQGLVARSEVEQAESEASRLGAASRESQLATARVEAEARGRERRHEAELDAAVADLAELAADLADARAAVLELQHQYESRVIRAPITGRVGETANLKVGQFVRAGETLASVVSDGVPHVVAEFVATGALGRVHPGQQAYMRLDAYPWQEYGLLAATVRSVSEEPRAGMVRVELDPIVASAPQLPLRHGLSGTVEIDVERISPAALVLRRAVGAVSAKPTALRDTPRQ